MSNLEVPGATLYYETVGSGPLLLCISGANGSCEIWRGLAQVLQTHFTVAAYDRRGFSRSYLSGPQDYSQRIQTDADDAARLIKHLSPTQPATVIGNSSGAMVSLMLLTRHPDVISTLVAHEPPAMAMLPDKEKWIAEQQEIYDTYRAGGPWPALQKFAKMVGYPFNEDMTGLMSGFNPRNGPFIANNTMYWFERELMVYPPYELDVAALDGVKQKLMLVNGKLTGKELIQYIGNVHLGEKLGLEVQLITGDHVAFAWQPKEFGEELLALLQQRGASA